MPKPASARHGFTENPDKLLAKLDAYRREKLGTLYGKFWVAPGVRWPSEFNADGAWKPLPPKKPAESVRFACEEERLKKASGAELAIPRRFERVASPLSMAATAPAYPNSEPRNSEKTRRYFSQEDLAELISYLPIKPNLQRSLLAWWKICTAPDGTEIRFLKPLKQQARAARICERTARYHRRALERLQIVEIAHAANTIRRPATHRMKLETLVGRPWRYCPACGHRHQSESECGCQVKYGQNQRVCRCKPPLDHSATPIRPQREAKHFSRHSPQRVPRSSPAPAQEPITRGKSAAPVREGGHRSSTAAIGSRSHRELVKLRQRLAFKVSKEIKQGSSLENAIIMAAQLEFISPAEAEEQLKIFRFAPPAPDPPPSPPGPRAERSLTVRADDPWQKILRALRANLNQHSFETWLKPTRYLGEENGVLYVRIPTADFRYIGEKYAQLISDAMKSLGMDYRDVQFEEERGP